MPVLARLGVIRASARPIRIVLLAGLALGVAISVGNPAYGEGAASSSRPSAASTSHETIYFGTVIPDNHAAVSDVTGVHSDLTITYKPIHPGVRYELTNLVLYNSRCQEITPGTWYLDSAPPAYGKATQGYTYGKLANGACRGITFKSRAIYYTWTHDKKAKKDKFKAYWAGGGKENLSNHL